MPVTDLAVKGGDLVVKAGDLVVATQGRAFRILDDLSPLRQWRSDVAASKVHLFAPRDTIRFQGGGDPAKPPKGAGQNPPPGAVISFRLKDAPKDAEVVSLEIRDGERVLGSFTSEKRDEKAVEEAESRVEKPLEPVAGLNRFSWDLRGLKPSLVPKAVLWGSKEGPLVAPGRYGIGLAAFGETRTASVEVVPNPVVEVSPADLARQASVAETAKTLESRLLAAAGVPLVQPLGPKVP